MTRRSILTAAAARANSRTRRRAAVTKSLALSALTVALVIAAVHGASVVEIGTGDVAVSNQSPPTTAPSRSSGAASQQEGIVRCANLTYARTKSSVCFADKFLRQAAAVTPIRTDGRFSKVLLEGDELYDFPFAIMTGEGAFTLTDAERKNLRRYLQRGGFLLASAGCSSTPWDQSFRAEIAKVFPDRRLVKLEMTHPVFHTVKDIDKLRLKHTTNAKLEGLEIDGRIVMIYSEQGLNDTGNAGGGCCCCGGNEILNAEDVNINILAYALTH